MDSKNREDAATRKIGPVPRFDGFHVIRPKARFKRQTSTHHHWLGSGQEEWESESASATRKIPVSLDSKLAMYVEELSLLACY